MGRRFSVLVLFSMLMLTLSYCGRNAVGDSSSMDFLVSAVAEGTTFNVASTTIYRFEIVEGAFEVCPPEAQPAHPEWWGWKTEVLIYKNRPVEWGGGFHAPEHPNPRNWDYAVGDPTLKSTYEEAEEAGKGMYVDIALEEGDYLILLVNDAKGYFWDNSGELHLSITECVAAEVDINPNTINLNRKELLLTVFIELPESYDVRGINVSSIKLNGIIPAKLTPTTVGDHNGNGIEDLMIKFEIPNEDVEHQTTSGLLKLLVTLSVGGKLFDGTVFSGSDTIRVMLPTPKPGFAPV